MQTALPWVAVLVAVVAVVVLAALLGRARRQLSEARAEVGERRRGRTVVVVDVRNDADLAAQRTKLARALSAVAPGATRALVHREVVRQLRVQLEEQGVHADIRVRRLAPPLPVAASDGSPPLEQQPPVGRGDAQPGPI